MVAIDAGYLLQRVLDQLGCDRAAFLRRVAARHEELGFGYLGTRPEKFSRWASGSRPDRHTEIAMVNLLDVFIDDADELGWPHWLVLALSDDRALMASPWTPDGSVRALRALDHLGGPTMERRGFLISGGALAATLAGWASASPATAINAADRRPRIDTGTVGLIESRLGALRRLDDRVAGVHGYRLARAELHFITETLDGTSYSAAVGRRLFAAAAEACRASGWAAFDAGHPATAERHYVAALRAASSADDPVVTANVLSFWAMARYSADDAVGALQLVDQAQRVAERAESPRMTAMLHARASRAHARAGNERASRTSEDAAFATLERVGAPEEEPACVYWVTQTELHSWAASNATDLGDPARALAHHKAIAGLQRENPDATVYPRSVALRLTRQAEAHHELGDLDRAAHTATQAVEAIGGVTSVRGNNNIADLKRKLSPHSRVPAVRDFLDSCAHVNV